MYISRVSLRNFRNYDLLNLDLNDGVNIFYGDNAQGKTNFLESIYLCAMGRSQRTHNDRELISFGSSHSSLQLLLNSDSFSDKIDVLLFKDKKKSISVNGLPISKFGDLFGVLLTVIFSPEDLQLIKSGPSERRKFMDIELCQISNIYYHELKQYYKILKHRNSLLKAIKSDSSLNSTLSIWDDQLVLHGIKIIKMRLAFTQQLSDLAASIYSSITNSKEILTVSYKPNCTESDFSDRLIKSRSRDVFHGITTCGIHKDDLSFFVNNFDVRIYGSQGQQRSVSLSAKLAEIELIKSKKHKVPVLLLDDVLSELDESRQLYLLNSIKSLQTILTCTGVEDVIKKLDYDYSLYSVRGGVIQQT